MRLGPYELQEEIGQGGMGTVYRALETRLQRYVAVKVLREDLAGDPVMVERFVREAKSLAKVRHPNLIHIYTVGEEEGKHYFAMELVEGQSLSKLLRVRGRLSMSESFHVAEQVLQALQALHAANLVHRDLKPSNLMLDRSGRVILMDFGLAKGAKDSTLTGEGVIVGTPQYMSPEQAKSQKLDGRSDLYTLGVVLFQALSGSLPFTAKSSMKILQMHIHEPPPSLNRPDLGIPASLDAIVQKLLKKNPAERFQTAGEVLSALSDFRRAQKLEKTATLSSQTTVTVPITQPRTPSSLQSTETSPASGQAETVALAAPQPAATQPASVSKKGRGRYVLLSFLAGMAACVILVVILIGYRMSRRGHQKESAPAYGVVIQMRDGRRLRGHLKRIENESLTYEPASGGDPKSLSLSEIDWFGPE